MVDAPNQGATGDASVPAADAWGAPPSESPLGVETEGGAFDDHPEVLVGGAFVGGLALALIVRRISR
jgi:hypothetical protein